MISDFSTATLAFRISSDCTNLTYSYDGQHYTAVAPHFIHMENCLVLPCIFIAASTYNIIGITIVTFSASVALEIPSTMFLYTKPIPQPHILNRPIAHDAIFYLCSHDGTLGSLFCTLHPCMHAQKCTKRLCCACTSTNMPDLVTLCTRIHLLYLASPIWKRPSVAS